MEKILIKGSEFSDTNLEFDVCSHLKPIEGLLETDGNVFDPNIQLTKDKDGASTRFLSKPIDFLLIEKSFELPNFIVFNKKENVVFCRRCWCEIRTR